MKTAATDMLGIEFPIFAFSHCRDVVAAVSKAGGLGVLGAVAHSPEQLEIDLAWIEEEIGDRPYGIDLIVPAKYAGDEGGGYTLDDIVSLIPDTHREFVNDILARYDVPELPADDNTRTGTSISGHDGNHRSAPTRPARSWRSPSRTRRPSSPTPSARRRNSSSTG